jgi:hypothetical protein
MPYLQYQRTHSRMISTGKRRRLNRDSRTAPHIAAPLYTAEVNATVPVIFGGIEMIRVMRKQQAQGTGNRQPSLAGQSHLLTI